MDKVIETKSQMIMRIAELSEANEQLQAENKTLEHTSNELRKRYSEDTTKLSAELQRYKDMEQKGLEEFKDVGGCWGCGIQESLNQVWADCKTYRQALQEIRDICKMDCGDCEYNQDCDCNFSECEESKIDDILDKINEVIGEK